MRCQCSNRASKTGYRSDISVRYRLDWHFKSRFAFTSIRGGMLGNLSIWRVTLLLTKESSAQDRLVKYHKLCQEKISQCSDNRTYRGSSCRSASASESGQRANGLRDYFRLAARNVYFLCKLCKVQVFAKSLLFLLHDLDLPLAGFAYLQRPENNSNFCSQF